MASTYITDNLPKAAEYLNANRLREALNLLKSISEHAMTWEITDSIKRVDEAYAYMLGYMTRGTDDPGREEMHQSLIADAYTLLDRLTRHVSSKDTPSLYYEALRYRRQMRGQLPSLAEQLASYESLIDRTSLFNLAAGDGFTSGDNSDETRQAEEVQDNIFDYIWTVYPLNGQDAETVGSILASEALPRTFRAHTVSAITRGLLEFFDENRILMLADAVAGNDTEISVRALIGLVLGLHKYRNRPLTRRIKDRLSALKDSPQWDSDMKMLQLELIRTRDTERINDKMQNEVIPEMMKLRPDIMRKFKDIRNDDEDIMSMEENPEWEELLNGSGLRDSLKEFGELQMEGSDVMMSTFSHLKSFPFFHKVSHWFMPFDSERSELKQAATGDATTVNELIQRVPFLCDSDKYSLMLSLANIPHGQRQMMMAQFEAQASQMAREALAASMSGQVDRRAAANSYLHDAYRFYKLFRRKREFYDPFAEPINLISVPILADSFHDAEPLRLIAELYFRFHAYEEALSVFRRLLEYAPPSAEIFQKIGYCLERAGQYAEALEQYRQAELFNATNVWTLRRMAACSKAASNLEDASGYYRRLADLKPDDAGIALNLANTLAQLEMYGEAIKLYYKVTFLDEKSAKPLRPLAWCLFVTGEFDRSRQLYERILADSPTPDDYLNIGHVALASGNISEAINYYRLSVTTSDGTVDTFASKLAQDRPSLERAGVEPSTIPLLVDAVFYSL